MNILNFTDKTCPSYLEAFVFVPSFWSSLRTMDRLLHLMCRLDIWSMRKRDVFIWDILSCACTGQGFAQQASYNLHQNHILCCWVDIQFINKALTLIFPLKINTLSLLDCLTNTGNLCSLQRCSQVSAHSDPDTNKCLTIWDITSLNRSREFTFNSSSGGTFTQVVSFCTYTFNKLWIGAWECVPASLCVCVCVCESSSQSVSQLVSESLCVCEAALITHRRKWLLAAEKKSLPDQQGREGCKCVITTSSSGVRADLSLRDSFQLFLWWICVCQRLRHRTVESFILFFNFMSSF